ncbi:class I SAM-dependent methyltransferase [Amycolatopsis taiwanensis]|uniref:class I SAM-dependent methyltransferase n=1 Tax=Amycolatopsis taiwanensis TaxID=342230 RepID=UPI002553C1DF|nr:class I SAM-dependent methyltransferase [Amycolatopsis taiwanensis]
MIPEHLAQEPSQTALTAAAARAAHPLVDAEPHIFVDTLAGRILGDRAEELLAYHHAHGDHPILAEARGQVIVRSRFTESRLAEAVERGVRQYVLLGAGLDSFAYRNPLDVTVFEADHPATQQWKRHQLEKAGIAIPERVSFVGVDFETDSPLERLTENGFDPEIPSFFCWLGVVPYLSRESVRRTLAQLPPGAELVADYMLPQHLRDEAGNAYATAVSAVAAEHGEPWLSYFEPDEMSLLLKESGFAHVEHFNQRDAIAPALWQRQDALAPRRLSQLVHAR